MLKFKKKYDKIYRKIFIYKLLCYNVIKLGLQYIAFTFLYYKQKHIYSYIQSGENKMWQTFIHSAN